MKRFRKVFVSILLVVISTILIGCEPISGAQDNPDTFISESIEETTSGTEIDTNETSTKETDKNKYVPQVTMKVHFIDVGQGDSILIESEGNFMLIDAGENDQGEEVVSYLKEQGVTKLDYIIGTHPHSDHIGGLDNVIEAFDIGKVILPEKEHLTITFEEVLDAVKNKGLSITKAVVGESYEIGNGEFL